MPTVRNPFPSIPTPTKTVEGLHATVSALQQVVALLVSNAQGAGQQTLPQNAYVFAQSDQVTQVSNAQGAIVNKTVTLQGQVNTLTAEVNALETEVATLTTEVASFPGGNIQAGTVASDTLAPGAVSVRAQDIESGSTTATANITLGVAGDVLVLAAFLVAVAGASGATISVQVDGGTTYSLLTAPFAGGVAEPGVGFILVPGLAAGLHSFVATAAIGGTPQSGVQVVAIGLMR